MSEESKQPDADYVKMGEPTPLIGGIDALQLDDPNLSQEDKDMRLAIALQQQENAAAYDAHKKKHDAAIAAQRNRVSRSGVHERLAAIRDKDQGMLTVPADYTTENAYVSGGDEKFLPPVGEKTAVKGSSPQETADHHLAATLQKVEQVGAATAAETHKIVKEEKGDDVGHHRRTERSNYHINQKGIRK